jgi:PAS domain S-box-containing protein
VDEPFNKGDLKGAVEACLEAAIALTGAQRGNIQLFDEHTGTFKIFIQRGFDEPFLKYFESVDAKSASACGAALRAGERIVVEDVLESPVFKSTPAQLVLLDAGVRAVQSTPLLSASGRILGVLSTHFERPHQLSAKEAQVLDVLARQATDLVQRFEAEKNLRQSEERYRGLISAAAEIVWLTDPEGRLQWISPKWFQLSGQTETTASAWGWLDAIHTEDRERIRDAWEHAVKAKTRYQVEWRMLLPDGSSRDFETRAVPIQDHRGEVREWVGVVFDIAERKQAQRALENSERRLRTLAIKLEDRVQERTRELAESVTQTRYQAELLDAANDAIFVRDRHAKINYWNKGAERLYGWKKEEALGKTTRELLKTEFPAPVDEIMKQSQEGGWEGELVHITKDGQRLIVVSHWTPLKNDQGSTIGWLTINTDITKRKHLEESTRKLGAHLLKSQDEERRRIARELHDSAGQTLVALSMNLDQLAMAGSLDEQQRGLLQDSTRLIEEIIKEVRTVSYLLHPPLLDEVGLGSALDWYVEGFEKRSGITTNLELPPDFGRLSQDAEIALFRIVQESLTNIHRHSGSATALVRLQRNAGEVQIEVIDQGNGMERNAVDSSGQQSMGVGLRGMRERIAQLGGDLQIKSGEKGTVVKAILPVAINTSTASARAGQEIA